MKPENELKTIVKEKYAQIALQNREQNENSCCGAAGSCSSDTAIMAEDYSHLSGYVEEANLGLGCGLPTEFAKMKEGDMVLDLGSGAGNDCFIARSVVGESGKVIGVDMTEVMVEKAHLNARKLGFSNVEFRQGEIEDLPVGGNRVDVVVSNCVLNLVPDKAQAFKETFRVLKAGGHFSISDIVLAGELPKGLKEDAEMYAGCVSGAIQLGEYLELVKAAGFVNLEIQKKRRIQLPNEVLSRYMNSTEVESFKSGTNGIFSITLYGEKAVETCCGGNSCC